MRGRGALGLLSQRSRVALQHAWRGRREARRARLADAVVLSRAKSGRTWLRVLLSRVYQRRHGLSEPLLLDFAPLRWRPATIPRILFTHGEYLDAEALACKRVVFLVRHPADVAVSEYFQSTRRARPHKQELHGVDLDASMFDFVMGRSLGIPAIIDYLNAWERALTPRDEVLRIRYEDLHASPDTTLARVAAHFGTPFSPAELEDAVAFGAFSNLQELERRGHFASPRLTPRDPSDPESFKVRRGKVGGYRDYFEPYQIARMDALVRRDLSTSFGYHEMAS